MEAAGITSAINVSDIKVAIEEAIDKLIMQLSCSARVNVRARLEVRTCVRTLVQVRGRVCTCGRRGTCVHMHR